MKNKNLIIGCVDNYNWHQIQNWVVSINEQVRHCTKVMLVYNVDDEVLTKLKDNDFVVYQRELSYQIVVQRFYDIWEIISMYEESELDWVLTTDVKDIVFQSCPFEWLNQKALGYDLVASSENISYANEEWSKNNALACFGASLTEMLLPHTIYNAGVIAGKANFVKELFIINCIISLVSKGYNQDQTAFNILLNTLLKFCKIFKPTEQEHWAAQIGTTLDPTREYSVFNIEPNPIIDNGQVVNTQGQKYCIVHQYDRNPELNKFFNEKYDVANESLTISELKIRKQWSDKYISAIGLTFVINEHFQRPIKMLEIGTCRAENAYKFLESCPQIEILDTVDPYLEFMDNTGGIDSKRINTFQDLAEKNLAEYKGRAFLHIMTAEEFYKTNPSKVYDVVFIDGNHDYDFVLNDMNNTYKYVPEGGIFAGHDFYLPEVAEALTFFREQNNITTPIQITQNATWFWFK